jgi:hypothetical protein
MVVQLPPQSLHEQGMAAPPAVQVKAKLARHSYFAFELWPATTNKKLSLTRKSILAWSNKKNFKLLTASDAPGDAFKKYAKKEDVSSFYVDKEIYGYDYYKRLLAELLIRKDILISVFELPAEIVMTPVLPKGAAVEVRQNTYTLSNTTQRFTVAQKRVVRNIREQWNAEIVYTKTADKVIPADIKIPPVLRAIGIRTNNPDVKVEDVTEPVASFLPTLLQAKELVFLNQLHDDFAKSTNDINVTPPFC